MQSASAPLELSNVMEQIVNFAICSLYGLTVK